jgi:predicted SnoaL-like aldol condensation-catalyzing enzyme
VKRPLWLNDQVPVLISNNKEKLIMTTARLRASVLGIAALITLCGYSAGAAAQPGKGPKACVQGKAQLDRNTQTVISYYTMAFNDGLPQQAVDNYVGVDENGEKLYIQHNPLAADGPQAFIDFVTFFKGLFPQMNINIVRTIAECDMVMTHGHMTLFPEDRGNAVVDIFRLDNTGRIVEHWDVVQEIPETSANDNGMF